MKAGKLQSAVWADLKERSIFLAVLVLFAVVSLLDHRFCSRMNILSILGDSSYIGIAAIGMTLCIVFGAFDLSVGAMLALLGVVAVTWAPRLQPAVGTVGFLVAIAAAGVACGLINGALVAGLRIPAFIATLGMMYVYRGAAFLVSGGQDQRLAADWFLALANTEAAGMPVVLLGGTALRGGLGNLGGTLLATALLGVMRIALDLANVKDEYQRLAIGLLLIGALALDGLRRARSVAA